MPKENTKPDQTDKKILYELDLNARAPCSKIGKKLSTSKEVINYRIKKLEESGIISGYQTVINLSRLGIMQFKICLCLEHLDSRKLFEIINQIKQKKEVKWIVSCFGNWDLIISLETESIADMEKLKSEILELFGENILRKAISILVEACVYNRDYLSNTHSLERERMIMDPSKIIKIDELDIRILKKISSNARMPLIELASELKSTPRIINYRIKQLVKNKVIMGFRISMDYNKLGVKFYKTFIHLENINQKRIKELEIYFANNKNIIHNVKVIGSWDYEPEFEVYTEKEFHDSMQELKDKFADIIQEIEVITITKEHKFVYF